MDAGCSETCSNKRRVSNKRRSDRSALEAVGGGFCQQHLTTIHARWLQVKVKASEIKKLQVN